MKITVRQSVDGAAVVSVSQDSGSDAAVSLISRFDLVNDQEGSEVRAVCTAHWGRVGRLPRPPALCRV